MSFRLNTIAFIVLSGVVHSFSQTTGQFDGPAELPRVYVKSSLADTPAPGKSVVVKDERELKDALDSAHCGDKILLQAGARFAGNFKLPAKNCDDAHWIILRTSADDSALPPEGTRLTPCYGGVASLPGRPAYPCPSPKNVLAKLVSTGPATPTLVVEEGANHYRLTGLEITRESQEVVYNMIMIKGTAHHIVFDRDWLHGTEQDETNRGISLGTSNYVAVVDSYLNDFHCVAVSGACGDSQTINGGLGDAQMGPYKIVNNFLEASGENILLGGGEATFTPADIEIRHNHFYKPIIWRSGQPGFIGGRSGKPFIVKNLFELKNAQRLLFEGNILENTWGGYSQAAFAILLTPKNQGNHCPLCRTMDVTIRYCRVSHSASGIQMGSGLSDGGGASSGGARYSIHDVVFDDLDPTYGGFGTLFQIGSVTPALRDIRFDHITGFPPKSLFLLGVDRDREKMINFTFTNNLVGVGQFEIFSTGGGDKNCASHPRAQGFEGVLKSCFSSFTFTHNALVGSGGGWPAGNLTPKDADAARMLDSKGGDYRLCRETKNGCRAVSPLLKAGSDGKDIGADFDAIKAATDGAE